MRTFWSTATRRAVPAGTFKRITESGTDGAIVSDVGGAHRDGSASSRGTSLQPPRTAVCAGSATGTVRKIKKGKKRRRSLNILVFLLERLYVGGLRGPPGCLGNLPRRRVFRQPQFTLRLGLGLGSIFGQDHFECGAERYRIAFGKNKRRTQLDHIMVWTVRPSENSPVSQPIYDVRSLKRCRFLRVPRNQEIQAQE